MAHLSAAAHPPAVLDTAEGGPGRGADLHLEIRGSEAL